jgi:hypothetical protein
MSIDSVIGALRHTATVRLRIAATRGVEREILRGCRHSLRELCAAAQLQASRDRRINPHDSYFRPEIQRRSLVHMQEDSI